MFKNIVDWFRGITLIEVLILAAFIVAMIINTVRLEKIERQNYLEEMRAFKQQADSALLRRW